MSDFYENENMDFEEEMETEDFGAEAGEEIDPDDDLQESIGVIEEEKAIEDTMYDEDNNYLGDEDDDVFKDSWENPEYTPEGSDIPMTFEILESAGESMIAEGDAILDILGPSENDAFNRIVVENKEGVVSYPDPDNPRGIITEDATGRDGDDFEGFSYDSNRDEFVWDGGDADFDDDDYEFEDDDDYEEDGDDMDEPMTLSEDDYEL